MQSVANVKCLLKCNVNISTICNSVANFFGMSVSKSNQCLFVQLVFCIVCKATSADKSSKDSSGMSSLSFSSNGLVSDTISDCIV